jgi:hypothetical protein
MKVSSKRLRSIISEEITRVISEQPRYPRGLAKHRSRASLPDVRSDEKRRARKGTRAGLAQADRATLSMYQAGEEMMSLGEYLEKNLYWVWDNPESEYDWLESSHDEKQQIMLDLGELAYAVENNRQHNLGLDQEIMLLNSTGDLARLSRDFEQGYSDAKFDEYMDRMLQRDLDY